MARRQAAWLRTERSFPADASSETQLCTALFRDRAAGASRGDSAAVSGRSEAKAPRRRAPGGVPTSDVPHEAPALFRLSASVAALWLAPALRSETDLQAVALAIRVGLKEFPQRAMR